MRCEELENAVKNWLRNPRKDKYLEPLLSGAATKPRVKDILTAKSTCKDPFRNQSYHEKNKLNSNTNESRKSTPNVLAEKQEFDSAGSGSQKTDFQFSESSGKDIAESESKNSTTSGSFICEDTQLDGKGARKNPTRKNSYDGKYFD